MPQADGNRLGRKGIVCAAVVSGGLAPMSGIGPWVHQFPCTEHRWCEAIPLGQVRKVISGPFYRQPLRRLSEEQYKALESRMIATRDPRT
jgi:hypothetical protein